MSLLRKLFSKNFRLASGIEKKMNTVTHAINHEINEFLIESVKKTLDEFDTDLKAFSKSQSNCLLILRGANDEKNNRKFDL